jgi:hypothetical protein
LNFGAVRFFRLFGCIRREAWTVLPDGGFFAFGEERDVIVA